MLVTGNTFDSIQFSPYFVGNGYSEQVKLNSKSIGQLINYDNAHLLDTRLKKEEYSAHTVNLVHCTTDISIENPTAFLMQINRIPFKGLKVEPVRNSGNGKLTSIVIMSKHRKKTGRKGRRIYLTLYDKYEESGKEEYKGIVRAEIKICNRAEIREYFGIYSTTLENVLLSKINPIHSIVKKVMDKIEYNMSSNSLKSFGQIRIIEPYFRQFNFNWSKIEMDLKLNSLSRYAIKKIYIQFIQCQEMLSDFNPEVIFAPLLDATHIQIANSI